MVARSGQIPLSRSCNSCQELRVFFPADNSQFCYSPAYFSATGQLQADTVGIPFPCMVLKYAASSVFYAGTEREVRPLLMPLAFVDGSPLKPSFGDRILQAAAVVFYRVQIFFSTDVNLRYCGFMSGRAFS